MSMGEIIIVPLDAGGGDGEGELFTLNDAGKAIRDHAAAKFPAPASGPPDPQASLDSFGSGMAHEDVTSEGAAEAIREVRRGKA